MIVVDTNVIAYFWLPGEFTAQAETALRRDADWIVPYLWRSEFRNVLATYVRAKKIAKTDARSIYLNAENMLNGREYAVTGSTTFELAFISNLSAYDCEYLALAEEYRCRFVTSDKKIVKAFPQKATALSEFGR